MVIQSSTGTSTRCAPGDPSSRRWAPCSRSPSVTPVQTQPGFVCQINGYPNTELLPDPSGQRLLGVLPRPRRWLVDLQPERSGQLQPRAGVVDRLPVRFWRSAIDEPGGAGACSCTDPDHGEAEADDGSTEVHHCGTEAHDRSGPQGTTATGDKPASSATRSAATPSSSVTPSGAASASSSATPSTSAPSATSSATPSDTASNTVSAQEAPKTGSGSSGRLVGGGVLLLALATAVAAVAVRRRRAGDTTAS